MGGTSSTPGYENVIDPNPIKLLPEQSIALFGILHAKNTLTWPDIIKHRRINFALCRANGIAAAQLYSMQPDIAQWICHGRCEVTNCRDMALWSPNPFTHFHCNIGDLVLLRKQLQPDTLRNCEITVTILRERYGLTGEIMCLLQYSPQEWIDLQLTEEDISSLSNAQFEKLFGKITRNDLLNRLLKVTRVHEQSSISETRRVQPRSVELKTVVTIDKPTREALTTVVAPDKHQALKPVAAGVEHLKSVAAGVAAADKHEAVLDTQDAEAKASDAIDTSVSRDAARAAAARAASAAEARAAETRASAAIAAEARAAETRVAAARAAEAIAAEVRDDASKVAEARSAEARSAEASAVDARAAEAEATTRLANKVSADLAE